MSERPVRVECRRCGRVVSVMAWPGVTPAYCSDDCRQAAGRENGAARMRRLVERRRSGSDLPAVLPGQPMLSGFDDTTAAT